MNKLQKHQYIFVKNFIDPESINTFSRYLEYKIRQAVIDNREDDVGTYVYCCYADPLAETVLYNSTQMVEEITGFDLYPTYTYIKLYQTGDQLLKHKDRESCEISATVNIGYKGQQWPIYMKSDGSDPSKYILDPGDAVIYLGREVLHWRERLEDDSINAQLMLHYVDKTGPCNLFKFDKRENLGFSKQS